MLDSKAFSEDIVINTEYDKEIKKPYLTPILTPNVIMLTVFTMPQRNSQMTSIQIKRLNKELLIELGVVDMHRLAPCLVY